MEEIRDGTIAKELSLFIYHLSSLDRGDKGRNYSQGAGVPQPSRQVQAGRGEAAGAGEAQVRENKLQ